MAGAHNRKVARRQSYARAMSELGNVQPADATRFWCEPHLSVEYDTVGFLAEQRDDGFRSINPHLLTTDELAEHRCVVMLGEPGMGKTYVLEGHKPLLTDSLVDVQ